MHRHNLHSGWRLNATGDLDAVPTHLRDTLSGTGIPATVPGCVHTDLMAADLIPDPYLGFNDREQAWVGHTDWRYTLRFDAPEGTRNAEHLDLVCQGLDTVATIRINGQTVGESANMFAPQRFDLKDAFRDRDNELTVTFGSPLRYVDQMVDRLGELPFTHTLDVGNPRVAFNMIRKMACNFGWDWGPALITSGIYRPIYLEAWNTTRITSVRPLNTHADIDHAIVDLFIDTQASVKESQAVEASYELTDPDGNAVASSTISFSPGETIHAPIHVDAPRLWWPVGHGEQPLYTLRVTLRSNDTLLDRVEKRIGLRSVELKTTSDNTPADPTFQFRINGKRIYCKGANWIPDDCFPHRVTPDRYRQRITQAREANMNMLRVWGGGLYETDDFYDICDELGILVWQDMLTACAAYPEEPPYPDLFEQEARHHIARLSSHPSLVLWNGGNECIWATFDWGPKWEALRQQDQRGWGLRYWLELFPKLIRELDPSRPYWANSPYSGSMDHHPNREDTGNCHHWDVWNGHGEYSNYLTHRPLFASEFGFQGPPTWTTLDRSVPATDRAWDAPGMHHHNRQDGGQERAHRLVNNYFIEPDDFDNWLYLAQLNQARALTLGCEWFRTQSPHNSGALYWQLNDCWPVASWAAIDGDGRPKPLWFATQRFFRDRLITIQPREQVPPDAPAGPLAVCFHNDHDDTWSGPCTVRLITLDGQTLHELTQPVTIPPRGSLQFDIPDTYLDHPDAFLVAELDGQRATWFFRYDKDLAYPAPEFDAQLTRHASELHLTITAQTLLRDLTIYPDRLDPNATIDDQAVTLLPGDTRTFTINTPRDLPLEALTTRPVLQVANHYGRPRQDA